MDIKKGDKVRLVDAKLEVVEVYRSQYSTKRYVRCKRNKETGTGTVENWYCETDLLADESE